MSNEDIEQLYSYLEDNRRGFRYFVLRSWFLCKETVRFIIRLPKYVKWSAQRLVHGYSDRDMWNADIYLAKIIATSLIWTVKHGKGVAWSYLGEEELHGDDISRAEARRNLDYLYYSMIFSEYARNNIAFNEEWQKSSGGVTEEQLNDALDWFKEHFTEFWD